MNTPPFLGDAIRVPAIFTEKADLLVKATKELMGVKDSLAKRSTFFAEDLNREIDGIGKSLLAQEGKNAGPGDLTHRAYEVEQGNIEIEAVLEESVDAIENLGENDYEKAVLSQIIKFPSGDFKARDHEQEKKTKAMLL